MTGRAPLGTAGVMSAEPARPDRAQRPAQARPITAGRSIAESGPIGDALLYSPTRRRRPQAAPASTLLDPPGARRYARASLPTFITPARGPAVGSCDLNEETTMKISANGIAMNYTLDGPASAPVVTLSH